MCHLRGWLLTRINTPGEVSITAFMLQEGMARVHLSTLQERREIPAYIFLQYLHLPSSHGYVWYICVWGGGRPNLPRHHPPPSLTSWPLPCVAVQVGQPPSGLLSTLFGTKIAGPPSIQHHLLLRAIRPPEWMDLLIVIGLLTQGCRKQNVLWYWGSLWLGHHLRLKWLCGWRLWEAVPPLPAAAAAAALAQEQEDAWEKSPGHIQEQEQQ